MLVQLAPAMLAGLANCVASKLSHKHCADVLKLQSSGTVAIDPNG
jgi:hypothetical protein